MGKGEKPEKQPQKKLIKESLDMYEDFKSKGLTNISGADKATKPDNMDDFIVNLERLDYDKDISWLRKGDLVSHASAELSEIYSFLRRIEN